MGILFICICDEQLNKIVYINVYLILNSFWVISENVFIYCTCIFIIHVALYYNLICAYIIFIYLGSFLYFEDIY